MKLEFHCNHCVGGEEPLKSIVVKYEGTDIESGLQERVRELMRSETDIEEAYEKLKAWQLEDDAKGSKMIEEDKLKGNTNG